MRRTLGRLLACQKLPHDWFLHAPMPLAWLGDGGPGFALIRWVGGLLLGAPVSRIFALFPILSFYFWTDCRFAASATLRTRAPKNSLPAF